MAGTMAEKSGVTVLTGYLGSGKTTLLRGLLAHPDLRDTAVIVNEFGEVGLDHLLVESGREDVVLLESGCLCCTVNDSLSETLADLVFRRARGEIPPFSRVVIETSGLADPAPILHCLMTDKLVADHYRFDGLVCVIDAMHGLKQLQTTSEPVKQAAIADRLVIAKTDIQDEAETARLIALLSTFNSRARVLRIVNGALNDPTEIVDIRAAEGLELASKPSEQAPVSHDGAGHHAHGDIVTASFVLDRPATWAGYDFWVNRLKEFRAGDLLRMKGVIGIGDRAAPHFVQGVQHLFSLPEPLDAWPWPDRKGRLVFITRGLDRATLARSLDSLGEPEGIRRPVSEQDAL